MMTKMHGTTVIGWLVMFWLGWSVSDAAQLSGRVVDTETGSPIWGANVRVVALDKVVETNRAGEFEFQKIDSGSYQLIVSHVGYDSLRVPEVAVPSVKPSEFRLTPAPWVLDGVVVTGTRSPHLLKDVPVQTEVITQRDFQRTGATTVDEALSSSIGINVVQDLSGSAVIMRGIQGDRVLVLVDGERAVGRVYGSIDLAQYDLSNVKKIEVVKGTGSTLYGSDAMGGVINIITNNPPAEALRLGFNSEYGSYVTTTHNGELSWGRPNVGVTFTGRYYHTDGFDLDKSTPHTNGQDNIDRFNFGGKARFQLSDRWRLGVDSRFMDESRTWVESEDFAGELYVYDDDESNHRYENAVTVDYLSGDKYSMQLRVNGSYYDHQWNKVNRETGAWTDTSKTEDVFVEAAYSSNYVIGDGHVATYGMDYYYQDLKSGELIGEKKADKAGDAYLQYEYSPHRAWTFLPGVRYENHSSFGEKVNPSINIMYAPAESFKLRGFVGYGFRAPSIKEQYFIFDHVAAGYIVYGGRVELPDYVIPYPGTTFRPLKDETSLNSSISAEFSYGSVGMHRITYYYNHLKDLIDFTMIGSSSTYWRGIYVYQNVERATTQGVEWESRVRLHDNVDFSFSYDYLKSLNLGTGEELTNRPAHTFKIYLSGFAPRWGMGATFWASHQSRKLWVPRSNTGGNEGEPDWAPSRTTLNLNVFKRFSNGLETFVRMENLLDQVNLDYGYWPGFQVYAGLRFNMDVQ